MWLEHFGALEAGHFLTEAQLVRECLTAQDRHSAPQAPVTVGAGVGAALGEPVSASARMQSRASPVQIGAADGATGPGDGDGSGPQSSQSVPLAQ